MSCLRDGLLAGLNVALSGAEVDAGAGAGAGAGDGGPLATEIERLHARTATLPPSVAEAPDEETGAWARAAAPLNAIVHDTRADFARGGDLALHAAMTQTWASVREVAVGALIPQGAGRVLMLAPAADAGPHARALQDALENLARTLSVEWARHGITTVALIPAPATREQDILELVAFLLSRAGGYFSGCRLDLA